MRKLMVRGGRPIGGVFTPSGNKNAALPMLAACLLTDQPVTLRNVPAIVDVGVMLDLLAGLGVDVSRKGRSVTLHAKCVDPGRLDRETCRRIRASILFAGPLLARCGTAGIHPPGGDIIGRRRIDTHLVGFRCLGAKIRSGSSVSCRADRLKGTRILLDEASVTATENLMMAATAARGETVLFHAACEPHVQNLARMLQGMGARIEGAGTNLIRIRGGVRLKGGTFTIDPDYIEAGSFMAAAFVTGGKLRVRGMGQDPAAEVIHRTFEKLGAPVKRDRRDLVVDGAAGMQVVDDVGTAIPKIEDGTWPAFPSDLMSVAIVMATQARGSVLFFEKLFESRMYFVDRLIEMGARIVQCDPHRVLVQGPARLHGIDMSSPDIRAGMAMVIAALCAKGRSVIHAADVIDRGYESIADRLGSLGADIESAGR